jgi:hypothetical protein
MTTLSAIEALALSKGLKADRDAVEAGEFGVDFTVRVTGTMSVAKDTSRDSTVSLPVKQVLALMIQRSGATREATIELLRKCMIEAMNASETGTEGEGALDGTIDAEWAKVTEELVKSLPRTRVRGAVKAKISVEVVSDEAALAAK